MIENTKLKTARWVTLKDLEREVKRTAVRFAEQQIKGGKRSLDFDNIAFNFDKF